MVSWHRDSSDYYFSRAGNTNLYRTVGRRWYTREYTYPQAAPMVFASRIQNAFRKYKVNKAREAIRRDKARAVAVLNMKYPRLIGKHQDILRYLS